MDEEMIRSSAKIRQTGKISDSLNRLNKAELLKFIEELENRKIELERQNRELTKAKETFEITKLQFNELYDHTPIGYYTISREGLIVGLNNNAASMLGNHHDFLINKNFNLYLSATSKPAFDSFIDQIFQKKLNATCEVTIPLVNDIPIFLSLTGIIIKNNEYTQIAALNITRRKLMENAYNFLLQCGYPGSDKDFFQTLAKYLSQKLLMEYVGIARFNDQDTLANVLIINKNGTVKINLSFPIAESVFGEVVGKIFYCIPENVSGLFPNDKLFGELKANSFIGSTLWNYEGKPIGIISVIGKKPFKNQFLAEPLMKIVAVRVSGELEREFAEEKLRKSELNLQKYIDFAPHGIFVANEKGEYIDVNPAASKITGFSEKELLSMNLIQLIPEVAIEAAKNHFRRVVEEGFASGELPFLKKDRSIGYWFVDAVKLSESRFLGFTVDITSHKQADAIIRENEQLLRESQNVASIGCYAIDINAGTWKASPEIYTILGIDETYPTTIESWIDRVQPDSQKQLLEYLTQSDIKKKHFDQEYKIIRQSDKKIRWVQGMGEIEQNQNLKTVRMIGTLQDITDRKTAEEQLMKYNEELEERVKERTYELLKFNRILLKTEEKYRTVADFTYDWEYWISEDNNIQYMSPSVERITGYKVAEFKANPNLLNQIVYVDDQAQWKNHKAESHKRKFDDAHFDIEIRIVAKSGEIRWIGHVCRRVFVNNKYKGIRVSNRDITEKIKAENELLNATVEVEVRERNNFARELHDGLGPLLSTIKLYFQWLTETGDPEKIKIISEKGNNSIDMAIQTTREIAFGLSTQFLNNYGYVDAILNFTQQINDTKKIAISFHFNSKERFSHLLETTLYRITTELINNTLKYAKASNIEIKFHYNKGKEILSLTYFDNGIGFDTTKTEKSSKGLGLLNINQRIKILGGLIKIESEKGHGMKVFLQVPVNPVSE